MTKGLRKFESKRGLRKKFLLILFLLRKSIYEKMMEENHEQEIRSPGDEAR